LAWQTLSRSAREGGVSSYEASACLQYRWPSIYLEQWQADVETFERSDHFTALRAFRNVGLAHRNDPNVPDPRSKSNTRRVMCGDARIVLEGTIPIVHRLNSLIKGVIHSPDFDRKRQEWELRAGKFWDAVAH
jgi:hypothetical protein